MKLLRWRVAVAASLLVLVGEAGASAAGLKGMAGCWVTPEFTPTSLETDAGKASSLSVVYEKSLLIFAPIMGTKYLVFGRLYEWDKAPTYVLGPVYENGAFDPVAETLTFGFPYGGLDTVRLRRDGTLLYIHTKSSDKSAMSVRMMKRLDCNDARALERDLLKRKEALAKSE